jgi:hypothetical protein
MSYAYFREGEIISNYPISSTFSSVDDTGYVLASLPIPWVSGKYVAIASVDMEQDSSPLNLILRVNVSDAMFPAGDIEKEIDQIEMGGYSPQVTLMGPFEWSENQTWQDHSHITHVHSDRPNLEVFAQTAVEGSASARARIVLMKVQDIRTTD